MMYNAVETPVFRVSDPNCFARLHWRLRTRLPVWVIREAIDRQTLKEVAP